MVFKRLRVELNILYYHWFRGPVTTAMKRLAVELAFVICALQFVSLQGQNDTTGGNSSAVDSMTTVVADGAGNSSSSIDSDSSSDGNGTTIITEGDGSTDAESGSTASHSPDATVTVDLQTTDEFPYSELLDDAVDEDEENAQTRPFSLTYGISLVIICHLLCYV
ncbi:hypothetical protein COOONC_23269 [Cooperia oncophora]